MQKPPFLRSLLGLLALSCSYAMAAPSPYSSMIVFGDSLSDAGQFGLRFTNRNADGSYAPVTPMILGSRLGVAPEELNPSTSIGTRPDGNNWAVGGYTTQQILDSITDTSRTVIPPGRPGAGLVLRERDGYLANGKFADPNALYYLTGGGNDFLQGLVNTPADAAAAGGRWPQAPRHCNREAHVTSWSGCCPTWARHPTTAARHWRARCRNCPVYSTSRC